MLHIGEGQTLCEEDVLLILPQEGAKPAEAGARILLGDGTWLQSILSAKTLQERLFQWEKLGIG